MVNFVADYASRIAFPGVDLSSGSRGLPMLTENVHLVPLLGHVTGTCLLTKIVQLIPQSVTRIASPGIDLSSGSLGLAGLAHEPDLETTYQCEPVSSFSKGGR